MMLSMLLLSNMQERKKLWKSAKPSHVGIDGLDGFQKCLQHCNSDESSPSIVKANISKSFFFYSNTTAHRGTNSTTYNLSSLYCS